ncbi:MAG: hypothetical protein AAFX05_09650 [Planctomycetota bacterium]
MRRRACGIGKTPLGESVEVIDPLTEGVRIRRRPLKAPEKPCRVWEDSVILGSMRSDVGSHAIEDFWERCSIRAMEIRVRPEPDDRGASGQ